MTGRSLDSIFSTDSRHTIIFVSRSFLSASSWNINTMKYLKWTIKSVLGRKSVTNGQKWLYFWIKEFSATLVISTCTLFNRASLQQSNIKYPNIFYNRNTNHRDQRGNPMYSTFISEDLSITASIWFDTIKSSNLSAFSTLTVFNPWPHHILDIWPVLICPWVV